MKKILIAVPTYESIFPRTYESIYNLDTDGNWAIFKAMQGYDVATARNNIAQAAIDQETDYVLMIDNDMVIPEDALINLLDDAKDVCLGYYINREAMDHKNMASSVCRLGEFNYTDKIPAAELLAMKRQGEYKLQIHGGGFGCALIRTEILTKLEYPWFDWVNYKDRRLLSEDIYFCEQCRKHKIKVYTDTRVGCGHIFRYVQVVAR